MYHEIRGKMAFRGDLEALILGSLQDESLHGYEIVKRLRESGCAALAVGEGLLYPALHKLEKDGFIAATWVPQEGRPARKVYTLTEKGKRELATRRTHWKEFSEAVSTLLAAKPAKEPS